MNAQRNELEHLKVLTSNLDWAKLLESVEGDQEFLRSLLLIFQTDIRATMHQADEAIQNNDANHLARAAHTAKGMLRNLSMERAAAAGAALEQAGLQGDLPKARALLLELKALLEAVRPEVEARLAQVER